MLAALLVNLPDYQKKSDSGGSELVAYRSTSRRTVLESAKKLEEYLYGKPVKEPIKRAVKRAREYVETDATPEEVFDLSAELQMRTVELQQELKKSEDQRDQAIDYLLVLNTFTVFLNYVQEDEEAILVLLLTE